MPPPASAWRTAPRTSRAVWPTSSPPSPHKETKTTEKYRLLSGTLTFKKGTTKTKLDETKLVPWLKANGYGELVKVEESTRWADLKKLLSYTGDIATLTETGEIVEGVTVYETPGIFTVDV